MLRTAETACAAEGVIGISAANRDAVRIYRGRQCYLRLASVIKRHAVGRIKLVRRSAVGPVGGGDIPTGAVGAAPDERSRCRAADGHRLRRRRGIEDRRRRAAHNGWGQTEAARDRAAAEIGDQSISAIEQAAHRRNDRGAALCKRAARAG